MTLRSGPAVLVAELTGEVGLLGLLDGLLDVEEELVEVLDLGVPLPLDVLEGLLGAGLPLAHVRTELALHVGPALGGLIVTVVVLAIAFLLVRYGAAKLGALGGDAEEQAALKAGEKLA